ncbi:MAG TPA: hypothetical protein VMF90_12280 [Rhizobiaceae bacterium]|nr:hypothetical protein [Rhizobiaceae bacterium]
MDRRLAMALDNVTEAISDELADNLAPKPQLRVVKPAEASAPELGREERRADMFRRDIAKLKQEIADRNRQCKSEDEDDRRGIRFLQDRIAERKAGRIEANSRDQRLIDSDNAALKCLKDE